ncbi:MAG: hypothetical protein JRI56_13020 [Deltaproteobacteria bacterium]|nr:hypothetical protein [Deltaproteobacteria bacterium]
MRQAEEQFELDKERGYHLEYSWVDGHYKPRKVPGTKFDSPWGYYIDDLVDSALTYRDEAEWVRPRSDVIELPDRCVREVRLYVSDENALAVAREYLHDWYAGSADWRVDPSDVAERLAVKVHDDSGLPVRAFVCKSVLNLKYPSMSECKPVAEVGF